MRSFVIAFTLALAACAVEPSGGGSLNIDGTQWRRIDRAADAPNFPTMAFDGARASGSSGCNHWSAAYQQSGQRLTFSGGMMTEMACDEPRMATEAAFLPLLEQTRFSRLDGDTLVLLDAARAEIARLERLR